MLNYPYGKKHRKIGTFIATSIANYIERENIDPKTFNKFFIDPFIGMGAPFLEIAKFLKTKGVKVFSGSDLCHPLMLLWQGVQDGFVPPDEEYSCDQFLHDKKQANPKHSRSPMESFHGFACGYAGHYYQTQRHEAMCRFVPQKARCGRNNVIRAAQLIGDLESDGGEVDFKCCDFFMAMAKRAPRGGVIYLDPPYEGTEAARYFDTELFWETAVKLGEHNLVFVSETREIPPPWTIVGEKKINNSAHGKAYSRIERLYVFPKTKRTLN